MKNPFGKLISGIALAFLLVGSTQMFGSDQKSEKQEQSIIGAWRTTVTIVNCQTGAAITTFKGLQTFNKGGTVAETTAGTAPSLRTPGHGVWSRHGWQDYSFVFMFDRFNADGTYAGSQTVRGELTLGESGNEFTVVSSTEIFNPAGLRIATGCSTATARRIE